MKGHLTFPNQTDISQGGRHRQLDTHTHSSRDSDGGGTENTKTNT